MNDHLKRKPPVFIPNAITAFGLLVGLLVIFKMNMIEPGSSNYSLIYSAALLLMVSATADFADGFVARWMRAQSQFGLIFDSLNDAITFGVAPVVIVLKTLSPEAKTLCSFWATAAAMAFCLCGVLRLVRYSTQKKPPLSVPVASELEKEVAIREKSRYFTGLPIPAGCMALVSLTLFLMSDFVTSYNYDLESIRIWALVLAQFFLGFLMISRWRFPAMSGLFLASRNPSYSTAVSLALMMALFLFLFSHHFALAFVSLIWSYVLGSWLLGLFYWVIGAKDRALAPRYDWSDSSGR